MNEAKKYLEKIKTMDDASKSINVERNMMSIDKRIAFINQFIKAKECGKNNNIEEMMSICQNLLREDLSDVSSEEFTIFFYLNIKLSIFLFFFSLLNIFI